MWDGVEQRDFYGLCDGERGAGGNCCGEEYLGEMFGAPSFRGFRLAGDGDWDSEGKR